MIENKIIFISPLDWGLGHATRCVPIIKELSTNNQVIIGMTSLNEDYFNSVFPELKKVHLPSYAISYSKKIPVWLKLLADAPRIKGVIEAEKRSLEKIIDEHKIDIVISDNRFGLSSKKAKCIFITHQLKIKAPFFSRIVNLINENYIHSFNEVWIPDYEDPKQRLSGQLSDSGHINIPVKYIGPKSSLAPLYEKKSSDEKTDYLILLSGVEPQRTILENLLLEKFKTSTKKIVLVRGTNQKTNIPNNKIQVYNFVSGYELKNIIVNAETVICRSGYSTLMDLHLLNKKRLILIPTPGQTEQEYLAEYWEEKFGVLKLIQNKIKSHIFR